LLPDFPALHVGLSISKPVTTTSNLTVSNSSGLRGSPMMSRASWPVDSRAFGNV
jgi:hypothetical protein